MKNIKFVSLVLFFLGLFVGQGAFADGFVMNLYYDTNTGKLSLVGDNDERVYRDPSADTSIVEFSKDTTTGPYILKLYDAKGINFSESEFDKQDGSFQLVIPYFSIAAKMEIVEKSSNKILSTEDLTPLMTCNGNGVCNPNIGENDSNCMGDCPVNSNKNSSTVSLSGESLNSTSTQTDSNTEDQSTWEKITDFFTNLFK